MFTCDAGWKVGCRLLLKGVPVQEQRRNFSILLIVVVILLCVYQEQMGNSNRGLAGETHSLSWSFQLVPQQSDITVKTGAWMDGS